MASDPSESTDLIFADVAQFTEEAARRAATAAQPPATASEEDPPAYRIALGREVLHLDAVEFRILMLLASRPYHPFTRHRMASAVSTDHETVREEDIDKHVASLRQQLRCFRDYVQSVPYIGYRFKA